MFPLTAPLQREFYERPTLTVARALIGTYLVHQRDGQRRIGRIVETEAYQGPKDLAAHSSRGRTRRTEVMFGAAGHAYVYLIYGFWDCLNVVTGSIGTPHAVLIRGLEPVEHLREKTWGPGLLCRAMRIDRSLNGADFCSSPLTLHAPRRGDPKPVIERTTRIGVDYAGDWAHKPWRFFERDSPFVSTARGAATLRARERALSGTHSPGIHPAHGDRSSASRSTSDVSKAARLIRRRSRPGGG